MARLPVTITGKSNTKTLASCLKKSTLLTIWWECAGPSFKLRPLTSPMTLGLWTLAVPFWKIEKKNNNNSFFSFIAWVLWGINEKPLCNRKLLSQVEDTINMYSLNAQRFFIVAAVCFISLGVALKNAACISVMMAFRPLLHQSQGRTSKNSFSWWK